MQVQINSKVRLTFYTAEGMTLKKQTALHGECVLPVVPHRKKNIYPNNTKVVCNKSRGLNVQKSWFETFLLDSSDFSIRVQQYPTAHQVVRLMKLPFLISCSP